MEAPSPADMVALREEARELRRERAAQTVESMQLLRKQKSELIATEKSQSADVVAKPCSIIAYAER